MRTHTTVTTVEAEARDAYVDLAGQLDEAVRASGVKEGLVVAYCMHTTCALLVNEWEDGALQDLRARLATLVPRAHDYVHDDFSKRSDIPDDERVNGRSHVAAMVLGGNSQTLPVAGGRPALGTWQRLFLVELDEPKERRIVFLVLGT